MSKKRGFGSFLKGAFIGASIALLFAPKKGSETREDLKVKIDEFLKKLQEIDYDEVKENLSKKVDELKKELQDLDKEKAIELARKKADQIKTKAEELITLAKEKGTPVVEKAAVEIKEKTVIVLKDVLARLEKGKEEPNAVEEPKKSSKNNLPKAKVAAKK